MSRSHFSVLSSIIVAACVCLTACKSPPKANLEEVVPLPAPAKPVPDVGVSPEAQGPLDVVTSDAIPRDAVADGAAAAEVVADPLAALPALAPAPALPVDFERYYQCVETNLSAVPSPALRRQLHVSLAAETARFDASRAQAVLLRATGRFPTGDEARLIGDVIASWDVRRAVLFALGLPGRWVSQEALESLVARVAAEQPALAVAIVDLIPARIAREDFLLHLVARLAGDHPESGGQLADRIIEPLLNDWAVALLAARGPVEQLAGALERLETLENPVVRDWALLALADHLLTQDPGLADSIVTRIQRSLIRDELLHHLSLAKVASDPDGALSQALRVGDDAMRRRCLEALSRELLPHKPGLARFLVEKKREPRLEPEGWLPWLERACHDHAHDAPEMFKELLRGLTPGQVTDGLVACCPGAPEATRKEASRRELSDHRLTRCYVCSGVVPDLLVATRTIGDARLRDEALACALERELPAEAETLTEALALFDEPLLKDESIPALVPALLDQERFDEALSLARSVQAPYLRCSALLPLLEVADDGVRGAADLAFQSAFDAIEDRWRRDDVTARRVEALWQANPVAAWHQVGALEDLSGAYQLARNLPMSTLSPDLRDQLMGQLPVGSARVFFCLQQMSGLGLGR